MGNVSTTSGSIPRPEKVLLLRTSLPQNPHSSRGPKSGSGSRIVTRSAQPCPPGSMVKEPKGRASPVSVTKFGLGAVVLPQPARFRTAAASRAAAETIRFIFLVSLTSGHARGGPESKTLNSTSRRKSWHPALEPRVESRNHTHSNLSFLSKN